MAIISGGSGGSGGGLTKLYDSGYLGSVQASIDSGAGGLSTAFSTLIIFTQLRTTSAVSVDYAGVQLNNNTGANYNRQDADEATSTWTVDTASGDNYMRLVLLSGSSATAGRFATGMILVPFYGGTSNNKYCLGWSALPTQSRGRIASGELATASAVTRVKVSDAHNGGNLDIGSRVVIFGV